MFEISNVRVDGDAFLGLKAELPNLPPLVLIVGNKGFMCGYLSIETAESFGAAAAVVTGVKSVDDALKAEIKSVTSKAKELGLAPGAVVKGVIGKLA